VAVHNPEKHKDNHKNSRVELTPPRFGSCNLQVPVLYPTVPYLYCSSFLHRHSTIAFSADKSNNLVISSRA